MFSKNQMGKTEVAECCRLHSNDGGITWL